MGGSVTAWMSVAAAVRGRGHERDGRPCQDRVVSDGSIPTGIALADGAGSASHAEVGALCAADTALNVLRTSPWDDEIGVRVVDAVQAQIRDLADRMDVKARALSSTLLAVVVRDDQFLAVHVGDGVVGVRESDGLRVLSPPDNGEFANETYFVTGRSALDRVRVYRGSALDVDGFVLMSDGAAASFYDPKQNRLAPGVEKLGRGLSTHSPESVSSALIQALAQNARARTQDDCSLALLWKATLRQSDLAARGGAFRRSFLGCRTQSSLEHRSSILASRAEDPSVSVRELASRTGLSASGVRYHLRELGRRVSLS